MLNSFNPCAANEDYHAFFSIQLCELVNDGVLKLEDLEFNAGTDKRKKEIIEAIKGRFWWREISITPVKRWKWQIEAKLNYELMPKYIPLFELVEQGIDPLQVENEYGKDRRIFSEYPETLLSGNSDYISNGSDSEYEHIRQGAITSEVIKYGEKYQHVMSLLLDELELFFSGLYATNINGL